MIALSMSRSTLLALLLALLTATGAVAVQPPRISFARTIPAPHDLAPAERIVVIYAIGDSSRVDAFVDDFVDTVARARTLRIENQVERNHHVRSELDKLRREHPADDYIEVHHFTCSGNERSAEGSEHDAATGERIRRTHHWVDAVCKARIEVLSGVTGKQIFSYAVSGEGTSPRAAELSEDDREVAYSQAAHYAAVRAAEEITPRIVRESIELDESAPEFDSAFAMISSGRLEDGRAIWEAALPRHRDNAALNYDLGAISEALGDLESAQRFFQAAVKLSPKETRYRSELELFRERVKR